VRPIPVAFHIGPLVVHTYGLGLAVTFWFAYRYFERRLRSAGYPTDWVLSLFVWVVVSAVIGARLMHVLATLSDYRTDPLAVLAVWRGGLSSWGGLIVAVPTGVLVTRRRCPQLRFGRALDLVAPVLAAAWAVGRILGPQLMVAGGGHLTHQWFGMYYADQAGKRLPVPIFQALEDGTIFCVLLYVERRVRRRAAAAEGSVPLAEAAFPAGTVIGGGMVLWGIERVLDEKLWLSYPGQLGDVLVEAAGLALAVAGVLVLGLTGRRWRRWVGAGLPSAGPGGATPAAVEPVEPPVVAEATDPRASPGWGPGARSSTGWEPEARSRTQDESEPGPAARSRSLGPEPGPAAAPQGGSPRAEVPGEGVSAAASANGPGRRKGASLSGS
jgi:phosphatidylglycerol---prolipoprotein diacylglyceryl transferase